MDHICHVDCTPEISPINGHTIHIMYPFEATKDAGKYQSEQNLNMTRREYRASGQDQSRNCRLWDFEHGYVK